MTHNLYPFKSITYNLSSEKPVSKFAFQMQPAALQLGIWGEKGCGKSYSLELCLRAINAQPIIMSAGELEDQWAGAPGWGSAG
jgi:ABC-type dipeptide/oligopeptide/nickel transport system ATPase component